MLWLAKARLCLCLSLPTYEYQNNMWYWGTMKINLFEKALKVSRDNHRKPEDPHARDG